MPRNGEHKKKLPSFPVYIPAEQEAWYLALLQASRWWDEDDNVASVLQNEKKKCDQVMQVRRAIRTAIGAKNAVIEHVSNLTRVSSHYPDSWHSKWPLPFNGCEKKRT
jgi:hypothetical protein